MDRLLRYFRIRKAVKVSDELLLKLKQNRENATVRTRLSKITFGDSGGTSRSQKLKALEDRIAKRIESQAEVRPYYVILRPTEKGAEIEVRKMANGLTTHYFPANR